MLGTLEILIETFALIMSIKQTVSLSRSMPSLNCQVSTVSTKGKVEADHPDKSGFRFTLVLKDLFSLPTLTNMGKELNGRNYNRKIVYLGAKLLLSIMYPRSQS